MDIYINKENAQFYEQLNAIAEINGEKMAQILGRAVQSFVKDSAILIASEKDWDRIISKMSKDDLLEANRLISSLNNRIMRKLCKK